MKHTLKPLKLTPDVSSESEDAGKNKDREQKKHVQFSDAVIG